jgi:hypothetical protein
MKLGSIIALSFLLAVGSAMADDIGGLQSKQQFHALKASVLQSIDKHEDKYKELSAEDQKKVLATFDRMETRWTKADDVSGLSPADRVEMANDQEVVTTILSHASADSRMVCERVATIGSNLPKNVCKSVAQRRRETKEMQDENPNGSLERH